MLRRLSSALDGIDERVKAAIVGTGVHSWGQRLTFQYNLLYAASLGASAVQLGLLNSIAGAVGSLAAVCVAAGLAVLLVDRACPRPLLQVRSGLRGLYEAADFPAGPVSSGTSHRQASPDYS